MLCYFQVDTKVNLLHIYPCPLFSRFFFSHIDHCRVLSIVPVLCSRSLLVIYFKHISVYMGFPGGAVV